MNCQDALDFIRIICNQRDYDFSHVEEEILQGAWEGKQYNEIAQAVNRSTIYIKNDKAKKLFDFLKRIFGKNMNKRNFKYIMMQELQNKEQYLLTSESNSETNALLKRGFYEDWSNNPPLASDFYGRKGEIERFTKWIFNEGCSLIAVYGLVGIGKKSLLYQLSQNIKHDFQFMIWRSLKSTSSFKELLIDLLNIFNKKSTNIREPEEKMLAELMGFLKEHRCLLVLTNIETTLKYGDSRYGYQPKFENFKLLLKCIGMEDHKSCLLLTSRQQLVTIRQLERIKDHKKPVYSWELKGLENQDAKQLLKAWNLSGKEQELQELINIFQGNPLCLTDICDYIHTIFNGNVTEGLLYIKKTFPYTEFLNKVNDDYKILPEVEKKLMKCLADFEKKQDSPSIDKLQQTLDKFSYSQIMSGLTNLINRSFIETIKITDQEGEKTAYKLQKNINDYWYKINSISLSVTNNY